MKIVAAFDSFKGSISAVQAGELAASVIRESHPEWSVAVVPMADGGEGTVAALIAARRGSLISCPGTTGPLLSRQLNAGYGWLEETQTAVIEMAAAAGLPWLAPAERNPWVTTTRGVGELMVAATAHGAGKILLTLGGSATVDGGTGAARALGWKFLDQDGNEVPEGGGGLLRIQRIQPPRDRPELPPLDALCDVRNPLCGPQGAAAVFGPQKGASPAMVQELDAGLLNLAHCIQRDLGKNVLDLPGGGAAGGFGAGAVAFFNAHLVPGVQAVAEAAGLRWYLQGAAWVLTGEGAFDQQSFTGKVVSGVRDYARTAGVQVAVIAGRVKVSEAIWREEGIAAAFALAPPEVPDTEAVAQTEPRLRAAVRQFLARLS